ncbi:hypothetical protein [Acaryochloris sp. IP29b_bin.148]|uniref:hypothetical protein n=1 Tax=Acaryochloris sp. IP29b_bin.148 TaxID=2969218 RepID=UPI00261CF3BC|nr:hypothetical protein [Acaryochloris sp. IP29b_bin.148]
MALVPVSFEALSDIKYSIALAPHERFCTPEFAVVKFSGMYRDGAAGKSDALFITAIMDAVQTAWFTPSLIMDFTDLEYRWGDEMEWIHDVGRFMPSPCSKPLAIIVSDKCRTGLQSLSSDEYNLHCVESYGDAVSLIRLREKDFDKCMDEWRSKLQGQ